MKFGTDFRRVTPIQQRAAYQQRYFLNDRFVDQRNSRYLFAGDQRQLDSRVP